MAITDPAVTVEDKPWRPGIKWAAMFREGTRLLCVLVGLALGTEFASTHQLAVQIVGVLVGYLVGRPIGHGTYRLSTMAGHKVQIATTPNLVVGSMAAIAGMLVAYVITFPLRNSQLVPLAVGYTSTGLVLWILGGGAWLIGRGYTEAILGSIGISTRPLVRAQAYDQQSGIILDTSVIMDGLLLSLAQSGLLTGELLIPTFVLDEVQAWADSADPSRSRRASIGLEHLKTIRENGWQRVTVLRDSVPEVGQVDAKVIALAVALKLAIATSDRALATTASLKSVHIIDLQALVEQLGANHTNGDIIQIELVKTGQQVGQAVGYTETGDMVVVSEAQALIGQTVPVILVHSVSTLKGRLFFGRLADSDVPATTATMTTS